MTDSKVYQINPGTSEAKMSCKLDMTLNPLYYPAGKEKGLDAVSYANSQPGLEIGFIKGTIREHEAKRQTW
ncbi:hypothetical protein [Dyadobacter jiangsuensis]|uniref:Uncharacterized protein n=1 Tax=Dyadobacter jiangsuensis TaxID=1591085 RepID=A0A2P8GIQ1_9BACT|nr:hypothetical protein [Dyadobacter jiangsuensis]PSL33854.1 hypothetical protein CLV60_101223 [Dyadobacter jiangsuensis]